MPRGRTARVTRVACEGFGQQLDRHVAAQARITGAIDLPMPPVPRWPVILVRTEALADHGENATTRDPPGLLAHEAVLVLRAPHPV